MRLKRYEIHIYDDVCVDLFNNGVLDKSINNTYKLEDLLNQQYKENQQLKQQLHDLPKKIVEEIKLQLFNHFKVKNIEQYENLPLIDSLFTADTVIEILDTILKRYGGEDE